MKLLNTPRQEVDFLAGALVGAKALSFGRVEVEKGFVDVAGCFYLTNDVFHGVLLMRGADAEDFLAAYEVFLMFPLPPQSFVAIEPLGLTQALVVLIDMVAAYAETNGNE